MLLGLVQGEELFNLLNQDEECELLRGRNLGVCIIQAPSTHVACTVV
jgi:hypothetical protein